MYCYRDKHIATFIIIVRTLVHYIFSFSDHLCSRCTYENISEQLSQIFKFVDISNDPTVRKQLIYKLFKGQLTFHEGQDCHCK